MEFSKISWVALNGVKYQQSDPRYVVEAGPLHNFSLNRILGNSHSFVFRPKFRVLYPRNPWYIDIRFTEHVDTLNVSRKNISKSGATPKFGP